MSELNLDNIVWDLDGLISPADIEYVRHLDAYSFLRYILDDTDLNAYKNYTKSTTTSHVFYDIIFLCKVFLFSPAYLRYKLLGVSESKVSFTTSPEIYDSLGILSISFDMSLFFTHYIKNTHSYIRNERFNDYASNPSEYYDRYKYHCICYGNSDIVSRYGHKCGYKTIIYELGPSGKKLSIDELLDLECYNRDYYIKDLTDFNSLSNTCLENVYLFLYGYKLDSLPLTITYDYTNYNNYYLDFDISDKKEELKLVSYHSYLVDDDGEYDCDDDGEYDCDEYDLYHFEYSGEKVKNEHKYDLYYFHYFLTKLNISINIYINGLFNPSLLKELSNFLIYPNFHIYIKSSSPNNIDDNFLLDGRIIGKIGKDNELVFPLNIAYSNSYINNLINSSYYKSSEERALYLYRNSRLGKENLGLVY